MRTRVPSTRIMMHYHRRLPEWALIVPYSLNTQSFDKSARSYLSSPAYSTTY